MHLWEIVHERKSKDNKWEPLEAVKLSSLKAGEAVQMNFDCSQMKNLREAIAKAYTLGAKGVGNSGAYVFGKKDEVLIVEGREQEYIRQLLDKNLGEQIWNELLDSDPDLATRLAFSRIQSNRMAAVKKFEAALKEARRENFWQSFFNENNWILGLGLTYNFINAQTQQVYLGGKGINNQGGSICDFMTISEGDARFNALVEIKLPHAQLLQSNPPRNRHYSVSQPLADAVAQIQGYCALWEKSSHDSDFTTDPPSIAAQPRGIVIIGNTAELDNDDKRRSFEMFRRNLYNPTILTYDEVLARAKRIVGMPTQDTDNDELLF